MKKDMPIIILAVAAIGVAAFAIFRNPSVITKEQPVFVDRPFMVEVPVAIVSPQPNIYNLYDVDAGMNIAEGAVQMGGGYQDPAREGLGGSTESEWDEWATEQYEQGGY